MSNSLYERDFYAWANAQAALLRAGKFDNADIENIAEEIQSLARGEKRALADRLTELLLHLLRWRFQPVFRGNVWRSMITEQRYRLDQHLADNPSLKSQIETIVHDAYRLARLAAERETGLARATFPKECPFTYDQAMDEDYLPD